MLYNTLPFAFIRVLSVAVIEESTTNPSATNRYPIVDILSLISVDMVFNRLSNVRLLLGIVIRPHATASLRLYRQSVLRKICNPLFESSLNHTVEENINGLLLLEHILMVYPVFV